MSDLEIFELAQRISAKPHRSPLSISDFIANCGRGSLRAFWICALVVRCALNAVVKLQQVFAIDQAMAHGA